MKSAWVEIFNYLEKLVYTPLHRTIVPVKDVIVHEAVIIIIFIIILLFSLQVYIIEKFTSHVLLGLNGLLLYILILFLVFQITSI